MQLTPATLPTRETSQTLRDIFRDGSCSRLEGLAEFLPPPDRALVIAYIRRASPTRELAAIAGISDKSIRTRLRTLIARMNTPSYSLIANNLNKWPRARRDVARALFLHGLPLKVAARHLNLTIPRLKEHRAATLALLEGLTPLPQGEGPGVGLLLPTPPSSSTQATVAPTALSA